MKGGFTLINVYNNNNIDVKGFCTENCICFDNSDYIHYITQNDSSY